MSKRDPTDPKAKDLLPPDAPPDDAPKRIAERRVVGWSLADRVIQRVDWRPAGNSREFWKRIEDDDPFLGRRAPPRVREEHTLYPADRIDRMPSASAPPPAPRAPAPEAPRPQPKASAPPPKPALTPDPRAARVPVPPTRAAEPPPEPVEAPPSGSRLPPQPPSSRTGRIRISGAERPPQPSTGIVKQPAAAEVRAEKEALREQGKKPDAPPPPRRSLDSVLAMLGELRAQESLHKQGLLDPGEGGGGDDRPPPKPQRLAEPAPVDRTPPKPQTPPRPEAPVDRTPPRPATPPRQAEPVDRTPPKPPTPVKAAEPAPPPKGPNAGLNDLFGGGAQEGRVRIGKRTAPAKKEGEEG